MIGSLVAPGLVLGLGVGLLFQYFGLEASWYTSALGAHLSWTLPFGVLVMFAVMSRFDRAWEEAARDLGASRWQIIWLVVVPILAPGLWRSRCSASRSPTTNSRARCRPPARSIRCRWRSGA